ncbi:MAG: hypothetical protein ACQES9_02125 [Myxococcota bacterium]
MLIYIITLFSILNLSPNKNYKILSSKKHKNLPAYKGVSPPKPKIPSIVPSPGKSCILVWPGFQQRPKQNYSRFFFLFTSKINLETSYLEVKKINYLRLSMSNCKAWEQNAWRDIITHFFKTPVEMVSFNVDKKNKKLIIDIEFKDKIIKPKLTKSSFIGYYLLILEFPDK